jgi:hypothetical protein
VKTDESSHDCLEIEFLGWSFDICRTWDEKKKMRIKT